MGRDKQKSAFEHAQNVRIHITKTCLYNFDPLELHFYLVKLVEAVLTNIHNLCFEQKYEKHLKFLSKQNRFLVVKFSIYLNRCVFAIRSHFTCARSYPGLCSPLIHSIISNDSGSVQRRLCEGNAQSLCPPSILYTSSRDCVTALHRLLTYIIR